MPWFRSLMSSVLMLMLLCSCGGPDPKLVLADAQIQFDMPALAIQVGQVGDRVLFVIVQRRDQDVLADSEAGLLDTDADFAQQQLAG